jgi:energy-coupling factor transporter ATP-binding protein EcfA2
MLKQLKIESFTVFSDADLQFASGLNVIVGENGCGKSHLLKLLYAISFENTSQGKRPNAQEPNKEILKHRYTEKLKGVFHVDSLSYLSEKDIAADYIAGLRDDAQLMQNIYVETSFDNTRSWAVDLSYRDQTLNTCFEYTEDVAYDTCKSGFVVNPFSIDFIINTPPKKWDNILPVFISTRELLTIYPGFVSIYDSHYLEFDETYRDTCILLGLPLLKGKREQQAKEMLKPLEVAMGGEIFLESGRFYLSTPNKGKIEISMVAEGQRKLAMLAQLMANGSLLDSGYLFWDEPESNLNPKLIKVVAKVILHLCNNGIQVFIASHSLFLLRELEILAEYNEFKEVKTRYFSLCLEDEGDVTVEQGDNIEDLKTLVLLDEELLQSDRYMESGL